MNINYSFIIPHKNSLQLLKRCVESIPEREDIEIIIVDDNSRDSEKPSFSRCNCIIEYLSSKESNGAGHARNIGLNKASGKWLLFADADDYYNQGFLQILDNYTSSNADVVYFNIRVLKNNQVTAHNYTFIEDYYKNPSTIDALKYRFQVPWNKMVSKEFIDKHGIEFEESLVGNDIFFSYQVGYYAKEVYVEKNIVYNYMINSNSIDHKKKNSPEYYACLFYHIFQCNEFYKLIRHPEWKKSVIKKLVSILYKKGVSQFILALKVLLTKHKDIKLARNKFIDIIIQKGL